jgi:hypothetical protein
LKYGHYFNIDFFILKWLQGLNDPVGQSRVRWIIQSDVPAQPKPYYIQTSEKSTKYYRRHAGQPSNEAELLFPGFLFDLFYR